LTHFVYRVEGTTAHTTECAAGPWSNQLQHGGAPASLICWVTERIPTKEPMQVTRLTVDLLRPVPIAPLEIAAEVVREGRKIQLCSVRLSANGVECVRASVLKVRTADLTLPDNVVDEKVELPPPEAGYAPQGLLGGNIAFVTGLTLRVVKGDFGKPGPAALWFRAERPIIAGEAISPLMRAALTGDFCNGVSSVLDFRKWTFINGDLTVSLARMPVGEWILLDAETWLGDKGAGLACARLADQRGYFGRAAQSLVVEPREE
jgi:hypothetical protein